MDLVRSIFVYFPESFRDNMYEFQFVTRARSFSFLAEVLILNCISSGINKVDDQMRTVLGFIVQHRLHNERLIKLAVEHGANVLLNMSRWNNSTIAGEIVSSKDIGSIRVMLSYMVNKKSSLDVGCNNILHYVAYCDILEIFSEVLKMVGDINIRNNWNHTPLHVAICNGNLRMVKRLLQLGANAHAFDAFENTTLMIATTIHPSKYEEKLEITRILIEYGVNVNARNSIGATALTGLCCEQETNLYLHDLLLNAGADVNIVNFVGAMPLHYICYKDVVDCTLLLDNGADIEAKYRDWCTPLYLTMIHGNIRNCEILLIRGAELGEFIMDNLSRLRINSNMTKLLSTYIFLRMSKEPTWCPEDAQIILDFTSRTEHLVPHCLSVLDEIELLKEVRLGNADKTMWHVATSTPEDVAKMLRNPEIRSALSLNENFALFNHFQTCICRKTQRASDLRLLYDRCVDEFSSVIHFDLPVLCVEKILDYLDTQMYTILLLAS